MNRIDLHVHSNKSDGSLSPTGLVQLAVQKKLSAFALTDHDTVDGIKEAMVAAADYNRALKKDPGLGIPLEVIPGIEFSTEYKGRDIHILGLYIQYDSPLFQKKLQEFVDSRVLRNQKMCQSLAGDGIDISYEKLLEEFPDAVITRSHYARYLLNHGYIKSMPEAFERYIGDHCKHFIPREKITPAQAVALIKEVHGLAILAHPILYGFGKDALEELVAGLKEAGLDGIEAIYCTYTPADERQIRSLAAKYQLLITGGSDFHGSNKANLELGTGYGKLFIPEDILTSLKQALKEQS